MVDAFLGKKYKLTTSENFDEFMKALGKFKIFNIFVNFLRQCSAEVDKILG